MAVKYKLGSVKTSNELFADLSNIERFKNKVCSKIGVLYR